MKNGQELFTGIVIFATDLINASENSEDGENNAHYIIRPRPELQN